MSREDEALLICKQDEIIAKAYEELLDVEKATEEKQKFLDKQVMDARKIYNDAIENFWKKAEPRLEELKLIEKGANLRLSKRGVIYKSSDEKYGMEEFIRNLLGK